MDERSRRKEKISLECILENMKRNQTINTTKTSFYKNIWNSKNTKDIWKVVHHILNPKSTTLEGNVNDINKFSNTTTERVTGKEAVKTSDIYSTITSLPENNTAELFKLQTTNSIEVLKIKKSLSNDCATGYDNLPIFLIKPVAEYIASSVYH